MQEKFSKENYQTFNSVTSQSSNEIPHYSKQGICSMHSAEIFWVSAAAGVLQPQSLLPSMWAHSKKIMEAVPLSGVKAPWCGLAFKVTIASAKRV